MKRIKIGIMGSSQIMHIIPLLEQQYDLINLQEILNKETKKIVRFIKFFVALTQVDILYSIYVDEHLEKKIAQAHLLRKKVVCHWIGTDVRMVAEGRVNLKRFKSIDYHLVCFEPLQKQLLEKGITSSLVPIVPFKVNFEICAMPNTHRVLIYMPKDKESEYGYEEILPVIKRFKNIWFDIVANDDYSKFSGLENVKMWGWVDLEMMEKIYNEISIVLRIHINDGLSMSVLEAMAKGKKIIWNCDFKYCLSGKNTNEIITSMNKLLSEPPQVDISAHNYIINNYSQERILNLYKKVFDKKENFE